MRNLARSVFFLLIGAGAVYIFMSTGDLPDKVASKFGTNNVVVAYMARDFYRWWMLGFGILLPIIVVAATAWLPRRAPHRMRLPNRDHWLAPERWDRTKASLSAQGYWIGSVITAFVIGLHYAIVESHRFTPPRLQSATMWVLFVVFFACIIALIAVYAIRFRRVR